MEFYLTPRPDGGSDAVSREGVLALFARHDLQVVRTETETRGRARSSKPGVGKWTRST